jgi:CRISPR type III-B/RAMP module-associated protein Cmr5
MNNKNYRTRDQQRSGLVFEKVRSIENTDNQKKYGSLCLSAATLIRSAGLVQALAFYAAKNDNHHQLLLQHLESELKTMGILAPNDQLMNRTMDADLITYMRLTQETIALCQWHKRFAQSVLKAETGGES